MNVIATANTIAARTRFLFGLLPSSPPPNVVAGRDSDPSDETCPVSEASRKHNPNARSGFGVRRTRQHHRRLDLALGDRPVAAQQGGGHVRGDEAEAVANVEADVPFGGRPGADQHASAAERAQVLDERAPHPTTLAAGEHVRVADEIHVVPGLDAHDADETRLDLVAPEGHAGGSLRVQLIAGHVRLMPAIGRDDAAVDLGWPLNQPPEL